MESKTDFEYQLQQEALEAATRQTSVGQNESNLCVYRDPHDGTEFEWDHARKAWFPKINDDFIAQYQATYGTNPESVQSDKLDTTLKKVETGDRSVSDEYKADSVEKKSDAASSSKRQETEQKDPHWFEVNDEHNTNVYVSNLPLDITDEEFAEFMKKCGLIMKDEKNQLKIKLYRDKMGLPKGDGRCCYIKVESVNLALNILDGYLFRDKVIKVERAKFMLKGKYDPSLKPKRKKNNKKDKDKQKKRMEKLFDWRPDKLPGERAKHEKVVVIKNMFDPKMFEDDPKLILEYRADLKDECEEKCGPIRKVDIFDLHPEGVTTVTFNEFADADKCIELMNGRFFAGRKLDAHYWDGKTKYKIQETEEEVQKRMKKWDQFLERET